MADCQSAAGCQPAPRRVNYTEGWSSFRTFPSCTVCTAGPATGCANCCRAAGRTTAISGRCAISASTVEKGETLGLVGPNGCGKSTLLQIVSGILQPTTGRVVTRGRIAALLELGAGFNPEFTGRENVYLNGEIMGLSRGGDRQGHALHRSLRRNRRVHRAAGEGVLQRHVRAAGVLHGHPRGPRDPDRGRGAGGGRRGLRQPLRAQVRGTARAQDHGAVRLARPGPGEAAFRPRHPAAQRPHRGAGRAQRRDQPLHRAGAGTAAGAGRRRKTACAASFRHGDGTSEILGVGDPERARRGGRLRWPAASRSRCGCARASTRRRTTRWWGS